MIIREMKDEMNGKLFTVITTIFPPGTCVQKLRQRLEAIPSPLVVVGDKKGPACFDLDGAVFLPLQEHDHLGFNITTILPTGHYARKNIGYLYAMMNDAGCIYETDDDNAPNDSWQKRGREVIARTVRHDGWFNVYRCFTDRLIWPRGLPLGEIRNDRVSVSLSDPGSVVAPVQQGLVDGSPDVDAAWRLILDEEFTFSRDPSVCLEPGAWCPFNSQNTWWWPEAFPLMYLPSNCSFRMTDIWRSFVAQRCLWAMGYGIVFHAPDVCQDRNEHNLMRDFEAEVPGYLGNSEFAETLNGLELAAGPGSAAENLRQCYDTLIMKGFFPREEMALVDAWCGDVAASLKGRKKKAKMVRE